MNEDVVVLGVPVECGGPRPGCEGGPAALRAAGLREALAGPGRAVRDLGDCAPDRMEPPAHPNPAIRHLAPAAGWIAAAERAAFAAAGRGRPVFLGGDHLMSAGTVAGLARHAARLRRPLFVLWLDAHADFHTLETTRTGNLHGTPVAYATGQAGFARHFPPLAAAVPAERFALLGVRSIDPGEARRLEATGIEVCGMERVRSRGIAAPLRALLERVREADGLLHVSLDADVLDPALAPGVGTPVAGGLGAEEARLAAEMLRESGRVTSLDLAELNPALDEGGATAGRLVDLAAVLLAPPAAARGALRRHRDARGRAA